MYEIARGPLVWLGFGIFFVGSLYRIISMLVLAKKDKVVYPYISAKASLRSLLHWMVPFGSVNMRKHPTFTLVAFAFHFCLLTTPLFALGHIIEWNTSWGVGWWHLPDGVTNVMTIIVVAGGFVFLLRRIANTTVRYVSTMGDFLLLAVVLGPFITGLMAYYQLFDYTTTITLHIVSGVLWLIVIPLTRIVHMLFFPFTRAYMGSEFGFRNAKDW